MQIKVMEVGNGKLNKIQITLTDLKCFQCISSDSWFLLHNCRRSDSRISARSNHSLGYN